MPYTLLMHILGEQTILAETEQLPSPSDSTITVTNIRQRDGKDLTNVDPAATHFIYPWSRVNFIEVLGAEEEEEIVGFARD
jgi:hypothetical protein